MFTFRILKEEEKEKEREAMVCEARRGSLRSARVNVKLKNIFKERRKRKKQVLETDNRRT